MIEPLTPNTQAILLLTAPLIAGRQETSHGLLSLGEYNRLALVLRRRQKQPTDLLAPDAHELIELCSEPLGRARVDALLKRGFLLSQAVERWNARAIWVISRADSRYPKRLRTRLKEDAPPVLYGCGDILLLEGGGLAVVGSRHADEERVTFTENVGRLSAEANRGIVSGGAKGIDSAAMRGAVVAGGRVVGVLADSLERAALARENREPLMDGRLALVSPYDPAAAFNVGHAMRRNKLIYALADAALVVNSDLEKGGTWAGAVEQLKRFRFVPVFVRNGADMSEGNAALLSRGGRPWPDPQSSDELSRTLAGASDSFTAELKQDTLPLFKQRETGNCDNAPVGEVAEAVPQSVEPRPNEIEPRLNENLLDAVRAILQHELLKPRTQDEVAILLDVVKPQAKAWLVRLVQEGTLEKVAKSRPVLYRTAGKTVGCSDLYRVPRSCT